jgi:hypothetical protein
LVGSGLFHRGAEFTESGGWKVFPIRRGKRGRPPMSSVLAERAPSEGPRSTRAVEDNRRPPPKWSGKRENSGKDVARCSSCSQNAHDETVLVRCAQLRAALATPSKKGIKNGRLSLGTRSGRPSSALTKQIEERRIARCARESRHSRRHHLRASEAPNSIMDFAEGALDHDSVHPI